jgi:hypothetical protein
MASFIELEKTGEETFLAYLMVPIQNLPEETEENHI